MQLVASSLTLSSLNKDCSSKFAETSFCYVYLLKFLKILTESGMRLWNDVNRSIVSNQLYKSLLL